MDCNSTIYCLLSKRFMPYAQQLAQYFFIIILHSINKWPNCDSTFVGLVVAYTATSLSSASGVMEKANPSGRRCQSSSVRGVLARTTAR